MLQILCGNLCRRLPKGISTVYRQACLQRSRLKNRAEPNDNKKFMNQFTSLEMCAGAGGQAIGLEKAGFDHAALVELEPAACATLRLNRPAWNVVEGDLRLFDGRPYKGIDLLAGGVPCTS